MDKHRATHRLDGEPETPADTRFFNLRESGYRGPIDQDGYPAPGPAAMRCPGCGEPAVRRPPTDLVPWQAHGRERPAWSHADGSSLCPVIGPGGYQPATPAPASSGPAGSAAGLGLPASDSEFLGSCAQLAGVLGGLAADVTGWAEDLAGLNLPPAVLAPLHAAATAITDAAAQTRQAADAFREAFTDARQAAAGGLRITGAGPG